MNGRTILITGCDRRYFPILCDFVKSVAAVGGFERVDFGVFDIDFEPEQKHWLEQYSAHIVHPESRPEWQALYGADRSHLTSLIRPRLREYFPGYEIYLYSDVDVWVQNWRGFDLYIEGARQEGLAITPQSHDAYRIGPVTHDWRLDLFRSLFDEAMAQHLMQCPHINAGIFALAATSPLWEVWRDSFDRAVAGGAAWFGAGQAILTHMIYVQKIPVRLLPATCNWQCHLALPMWDETRGRLVEPLPPHDEIDLMHMTAHTKFQRHDIRSTRGKLMKDFSLWYSAQLPPPPEDT
jgi:hypothetical protein